MNPIILNTIFIGVTLSVFFGSTVFFMKSRSRYINELKIKTNLLDEVYQSEKVPLESYNPDTQSLAHDVCAIKQQNKRSYVSFNDGRIELLRHPSQIINDFSIASFSSIPAVLTTIGILGTFVGITIGLSGLNGFGSDSSTLIDQASTLIGGLGTAFYTSIAGMGTSFLFMLFISRSVAITKKAKSDFVSEIQAISVVVTSNDLLHQLVIGQRQSNQQNDSLNQLIDVLNTLANKPNAMTSLEFEEHTSNHLNVLCTKLEAIETSILKQLADLNLDEQLLASTINDHFKAALNDALTAPTSLLNEIHHEHKQLNKAAYSLIGLVENITTNNTAQLTISDIEQVLSQRVSAPIHEQTVILSKSIDALETKLSAISSKIVTESKLESIVSISLTSPIIESLSLIQDASNNMQSIVTTIPEQLAEQISSVNKSTDKIGKILTSIDYMSENMLSNLSLVDALSSQVKAPIENIQIDINKHAINSLETNKNVILAINDLSQARTDEFESLIDKMGEEVIGPIVTELSRTNKVVTDFAEISNQLNQSVSKTVEEMSKATATVENFELHTLKKLNDFAQSMDHSLNDFAINSTAALNSITQEVKGIVELGNASIEKQTASFSQMVSDSEIIFKQQSQTLIDVGANSAALMATARQELEAGLGDIDSKVINMSSTIQLELESFREEYQQKLTHYFNQQNTLLDHSLNAQRDGLNEVVGNFKAVFEDEYNKRSDLIEDLNTHHKQMIDVIERVQTMAKSLGLENTSWVDTLQLQSQHIGRQMADLGLVFSSASEEFKSLTSQMRPEMDDYFKRANKSAGEYFSSFDATSSRIYTRLDSAVDLMITVMEEAKQEKENLLKLQSKAS